jgi:hypothetical protein
LIQAAINDLPERDHASRQERGIRLLSECLYADILGGSESERTLIIQALSARKPFELKKADWEKFWELIAAYNNASPLRIAEAIATVSNTDRRPIAIISFNAEPLLFALINRCYALKNPSALSDSTIKVLARRTDELEMDTRGHIPFYHVHGVMPIPGADRFNRLLSSGKLVFSEEQYLGLSRSVYSWQSATFLNCCTHHRIVFVGVSFSDPNLRRWLSWEYESRRKELQRIGVPGTRPFHFWLKKRPNERAADDRISVEQKLVDKSVEHLGVRVVWLNDWNEVGPKLNQMLES